MKTKSKFYKSTLIVVLITVLLLMIPLLAMQFTDEVVWHLFDFIIAGVLLFGTGFTYLLLTKKSSNVTLRIGFAMALATGLFLIWSNLAVGIIGTESNPANLMYLAVLAVGIIGACLARFRPKGMVLALFATALAQVVVVIIALVTGIYPPDSSTTEIWGPNGFFVLLWTVSALLFRFGARVQPQKKTAAVQ